MAARKKAPAKKKAAKRKSRKKTAARKKARATSTAGKKKRKPGRPRKKIDENQVRILASMQCTQEEIASVMGCSVDTLARRFADTIKEGQLEGRASLRRYQWAGAKKGSPAMLIWLGKQMLGQKDQVESTERVEFTGLKWRVVDPEERDESEIPTPGE